MLELALSISAVIFVGFVLMKSLAFIFKLLLLLAAAGCVIWVVMSLAGMLGRS